MRIEKVQGKPNISPKEALNRVHSFVLSTFSDRTLPLEDCIEGVLALEGHNATKGPAVSSYLKVITPEVKDILMKDLDKTDESYSQNRSTEVLVRIRDRMAVASILQLENNEECRNRLEELKRKYPQEELDNAASEITGAYAGRSSDFSPWDDVTPDDITLGRESSTEQIEWLPLVGVENGAFASLPEKGDARVEGTNRIDMAKVVASVIRRNVSGKLWEGTTVNKVNIAAGYYPSREFGDKGPDKIDYTPLQLAVQRIQSRIYNNYYDFPELVNSHIVCLSPSATDNQNMVLSIFFFQDPKANDARSHYTPAHVQAELPKDSMDELINGITGNPDLLEEFYQEVFKGLDSVKDQQGIRRVCSNGFYLITDSSEEAIKDLLSTDGHSFDAPSKLKAFFGSLDKYQYGNGSYGPGEPFKPK